LERASRPRIVIAVAIAVVVLTIAVGVALHRIDETRTLRGFPYGVSLSTEGSLEAGKVTQICTTIVDNAHLSGGEMLFLSVDLGHCFRPLSPDSGDDPWCLPNVWNLSGIDLSREKQFILHATPIWGAEMRLRAVIWSPIAEASAANVSETGLPTGRVDILNEGYLEITTRWQYEFMMSMIGAITAGESVLMEFTVTGELETEIPYSLMYFSLELRDLTLDAEDRADNPWHMSNIWNVTGMDLSGGKRFVVNASADVPGYPAVEARIWSPIGSWSSVIFDERNTTDVRSLLLWGSQSFMLGIDM